ncbi:serine acetyltransferase [Alteromonas aestuariivivens]|uniref:Serine acetyltransferase n=1 Tax=Alteromonas aestuariivivens TaxID=1938339 RepID=A0A3D8MBI7_9ALTE|nr:serine acetyltransferase [Alteromonas aestuariivivens]RDV27501.1 serine acetyltransferase [Alteromonas aestuariivivens]
MNLTADIKQSMRIQEKSGACGLISTLFSSVFWAVAVYRYGRMIQRLPAPLAIPAKIAYWTMFYLIQSLFGISIQLWGKIGEGFVIVRGGCIFIVAESIGRQFTVFPGVTVGNVRGSKRLPIIGDNVTLEPGVKVLGEVNIGNNVIVRANSLVLSDVPDNSVVIGNPVKITSTSSSVAYKPPIPKPAHLAPYCGPLNDLSETDLCKEN